MSKGKKPFHYYKRRVFLTTSAIYRIWKIWSAYGGVALHVDGCIVAVDMSTWLQRTVI